MRGAEFLRRIRKLARRRGIPFEWRPERGKGSHGVLILGERRTVVPDLRAELKSGTYHALLKQLGLTQENFR